MLDIHLAINMCLSMMINKNVIKIATKMDNATLSIIHLSANGMEEIAVNLHAEEIMSQFLLVAMAGVHTNHPRDCFIFKFDVFVFVLCRYDCKDPSHTENNVGFPEVELQISLQLHSPSISATTDEAVIVDAAMAVSPSLAMGVVTSYEVISWIEDTRLRQERLESPQSKRQSPSSRHLSGTALVTLIATSTSGVDFESPQTWSDAIDNELGEAVDSGALNYELADRCGGCDLTAG